MKLKEYYLFAKNELNKSGVEPMEAQLLCEKFFGADRREIALKPEKIVENGPEFLAAVEKRKSGYPLQYILGYWFFDDMKLSVSSGVLIPREDTLVLSGAAAEFIGNIPKKGLDLCAGSGAVGLSIIKKCPKAEITAIELFPAALACLQKNLSAFGDGRAKIMEGNILSKELINSYSGLDFIVSNPPYISSSEIDGLQTEVKNEPHEALDGGDDGLDFYRVITRDWARALCPGGLLATEIGETQAAAVTALFLENGFTDVCEITDINSLPRVITGKAKLFTIYS